MEDIDPDMIKAELRGMSIEDLVGVLDSKGASSQGTTEELVDRLAAIIVEEVER